jgi:RsiW-degrading membrane proteinase PrsW (M82 family)
MGPPLRRARVCSFICAALIGALVFSALIHLSLLRAMPGDVENVFARALALSTLLSIPPVVLLWNIDRSERKTPWFFAAAFLWGGLIATAFAMLFNTVFLSLVDAWVAQNPTIFRLLGPEAPLLLAAPISAPIFEEVAKALGVLVVFWFQRVEFNSVRDGIVYGALVGAGFNWLEAALYVAQNYAKFGEAPYGLQLGVRFALFGFGGHAMLTAIFGAFVGAALQVRQLWLRIATVIFGLLLSVLVHMVHNALPLLAALVSAAAGEPPPGREPPPDIGFLEAFLAGSLTEFVILAPFLLIAATAVWQIAKLERQVAREELAEEVGRAVTPKEYREIVVDPALHTRRIDTIRPRASAALVNAQHELAFNKRRVRDEGNDVDIDRFVAGWRDEIRRLRSLLS